VPPIRYRRLNQIRDEHDFDKYVDPRTGLALFSTGDRSIAQNVIAPVGVLKMLFTTGC
jgi:hypothetical protein